MDEMDRNYLLRTKGIKRVKSGLSISAAENNSSCFQAL